MQGGNFVTVVLFARNTFLTNFKIAISNFSCKKHLVPSRGKLHSAEGSEPAFEKVNEENDVSAVEYELQN